METEKRKMSDTTFAIFTIEQVAEVVAAIAQLDGESYANEVIHELLSDFPPSTIEPKLSAAGTYGLIRRSKGEVTLTGLGRRILNPKTEEQAKLRAFFNVKLFCDLAHLLDERRIPPANDLKAKIKELGVVDCQIDRVHKIFLTSASQVGLHQPGSNFYVPPDFKRQPVVKSPKKTYFVPQTNDPYTAIRKNVHPLVVELFKELPPIGSVWPAEERIKWMQAMMAIFDLIYKRLPGEDPIKFVYYIVDKKDWDDKKHQALAELYTEGKAKRID